MSKRTLLILGGIFIVLAIAASSSWWSGYLNFIKTSSRNAELDFSPFTKEATEKIIISKQGGEAKTLTKESEGWKISGFDVSSKTIDDFFETLKALKVGSLVSKNPENYTNFGVGEDGYALALTKGGQEITFIIGSRGSSFGSFYARKKDGTNVYSVEGSLSDKLSRDVSGWRDKTLANIPKEVIQKIEIISKSAPLAITKTQDGKWQAQGSSNKATLEDATVNRLFAALNPLEASDFLNKEQEAEFEKATDKTILRVLDAANKVLTEVRLLKKDASWWARVEGKEIYYQISSYKLSDILLTYEEVFKDKKQ